LIVPEKYLPMIKGANYGSTNTPLNLLVFMVDPEGLKSSTNRRNIVLIALQKDSGNV